MQNEKGLFFSYKAYTSKPKSKPKSSLVYTPTIHKKRRRALRARFSDKSLQVRGLFLVNKSKKASTCRREAAALTVQCLPRAKS